MAGHGPPPKDPSRLVGHGAQKAREQQGMRVVQATRAEQPSLSDVFGEMNPMTGEPWSQATRRLWTELGTFPSTDLLQPAQWSVLARAMMLDDAMVSGDPKLAAEVRLQLQKFGVAPDDVARLRIVFAQADEAEDRRGRTNVPTARERRGPLKAV